MQAPILVLASESAYRRELLDRLRLPYLACAHQYDERAHPTSETLEKHALSLAQKKAESIAHLYPQATIIASDQISEQNGSVMHKPGTKARAIEQLTRLSGKSHRLLTAVVLRSPSGTITSALDVHRMHMRMLSTSEIHRYIDADSPLDCSGSYKIECLGISLFESIEGDDFTAITGLPLLSLSRLLREAGFSIP